MKELRSAAFYTFLNLIGVLAMKIAWQRAYEKRFSEVMEGVENFFKDPRKSDWLEYVTSGGTIPNED